MSISGSFSIWWTTPTKPFQPRREFAKADLFCLCNATTVYICLLYLQELDGCRVIRVIWHSDIPGLGVCFEGPFVPNRSAWQDSWWMCLCTTWWIARLANRPAHSSFLCPEHQESSSTFMMVCWKIWEGILTCKVQHPATRFSLKIAAKRCLLSSEHPGTTDFWLSARLPGEESHLSGRFRHVQPTLVRSCLPCHQVHTSENKVWIIMNPWIDATWKVPLTKLNHSSRMFKVSWTPTRLGFYNVLELICIKIQANSTSWWWNSPSWWWHSTVVNGEIPPVNGACRLVGR